MSGWRKWNTPTVVGYLALRRAVSNYRFESCLRHLNLLLSLYGRSVCGHQLPTENRFESDARNGVDINYGIRIGKVEI